MKPTKKPGDPLALPAKRARPQGRTDPKRAAGSAQRALDVDEKVLRVGHECAHRQAAAVAQLAHDELGDVHTVQIGRAHASVPDAERGRHVAYGDGMQLRGHAQDGRRLAHLCAHGVLRAVDIAIHLGQRAVVADGAGQHERHAAAHAGVHDAVPDAVGVEEGRNGAAGAHLVEHVDVVVVPVGRGALRVDVLAQRRAQQPGLQVVGGQGIARQQRMAVAALDQDAHGAARIGVKRAGGAEHPQDAAMLALMAQQAVQLVVVARIGRLTRPALTEGEAFLRAGVRRVEAVRMHVDALRAVLRAPEHDRIALAQIAKLAHGDASVGLQDRHAVHAALRRKRPDAAYAVVLGKDRRGVITLRRDAVRWRGRGARVACAGNARKVRLAVRGQGKRH